MLKPLLLLLLAKSSIVFAQANPFESSIGRYEVLSANCKVGSHKSVAGCDTEAVELKWDRSQKTILVLEYQTGNKVQTHELFEGAEIKDGVVQTGKIVGTPDWAEWTLSSTQGNIRKRFMLLMRKNSEGKLFFETFYFEFTDRPKPVQSRRFEIRRAS